MSNRKMTMHVADAPYKPGDILHINDERWIVLELVFEGYSRLIRCEPLADYLAAKTVIKINDETITVAEYLAFLCNEYENNCAC